MNDPVRELAEKATPGPWEWHAEEDWHDRTEHPRIGNVSGKRGALAIFVNEHDARLIALAPDLARVAADLAESLRHNYELHGVDPVGCAALAAYEQLQERAKR